MISEQLRDRKIILPALALTIGGAACSGNKTHAEAPQPGHPSTAATSESNTPMGYDVSFPQCDQPLPKAADFAIVGLNGTLANNWNDCFAGQEEWANNLADDGNDSPSAVYVHFASPGNKVPSWPKQGHNNYGNCSGEDNPACAYQYGVNLAVADMQHVSDGQLEAARTYFIDVETDYSFEPKHKTTNRAVLEGMTHGFQTGGASTGIYSDAASWEQIVGSVPISSELHGLPDWVLGARTLTDAEANCQTKGFTGRVVLAQIPGEANGLGIDQDIAC